MQYEKCCEEYQSVVKSTVGDQRSVPLRPTLEGMNLMCQGQLLGGDEASGRS